MPSGTDNVRNDHRLRNAVLNYMYSRKTNGFVSQISQCNVRKGSEKK